MSDLYEDARGVIQTVRLRGKRVNILFSKAGTYRSGDKHPVIQHDIIISGKAWVQYPIADGNHRFPLFAGYLCQVPAHVPHLFHFDEDTLMVEWWGEGEEPQVEYYPPYRDVVERHLREMKG